MKESSDELPTQPPQFADVRRVAEILGMSASHLNKLRVYDPKNSPPTIRVGRRVLYPLTGPNSLSTWAAERVRVTESAR